MLNLSIYASPNTNNILNNCCRNILLLILVDVCTGVFSVIIHEQWELKYSNYLILLDIEKGNPGRNKYYHFLALTVDFIVFNDVQRIN